MQEQQIKRKFITGQILACLAFCSALSLVAILAAKHLTGFTDSTLIISTCSQPYFLAKYSNMLLQLKLIFVAALLVCVLSVLTAVYAMWIYRNKQMLVASKVSVRCVMIMLAVLAGVVVFGKSVMFLVEFTHMESCSIEYEGTTVIVMVGLSALFFLCHLLLQLLVIIECKTTEQPKQHQKYLEQPKYQSNVLQRQQQLLQQQTLNNLQFNDQPLRPNLFNERQQPDKHRDTGYYSNGYASKLKSEEKSVNNLPFQRRQSLQQAHHGNILPQQRDELCLDISKLNRSRSFSRKESASKMSHYMSYFNLLNSQPQAEKYEQIQERIREKYKA